MGIFSNSSTFDSLLDKATSQLQLEPDWNLILQICDSIRQEDISPKYAVAAIKRKIFDKNPHVAKFGLIVLEVCVKNCGSPIHKEVATKELMDSFRELVKTGPEPVKEQVLSMIQTWSHAFRKETKYKWVQDTFNLMKMEGYKFPPFDSSSDALFTAETAPEWAEGDVCHMCRVKFSTFQRQHHCRSCGQVFCQKCSSRVSIIPQYGIEREVRVCDPCFHKINPGAGKSEDGQSKKSESAASDSDLPAEYLNSPLSRENQVPAQKSQREIQEEEEEELQLAMALSLSQEEAAKDTRQHSTQKSSSYSAAAEAPYSSRRQTSSLYSSAVNDVEQDSSNMDPELQRYLNRSYWEERNERQTSTRGRSSPSASAPAQIASPPDVEYTEARIGGLKGKKKKKEKRRKESFDYMANSDTINNMVDTGSVGNTEVSETMVKNFESSVEMLLDRMQKVSAQGKHIAMDATVQSLFQTVSAMHPQILRLMEEQEQSKAKYEALQVKVGLVREARASLEEMREQHREKVRQQELEQDMLRRMQIEQKLELMRQQKAEYLAYQQRLQTERQAAIEQQQQQQRLQYQRQMQQQQQYGGQYLGGDSSPYSSLNYVPMTAPSSQPYNTQNPAVGYTPNVPVGYQVPDAPPPSQYPSRPPPEGYLQNPATDYMPYRAEASAPQTDPQPSSLPFQQPSPLEYQMTSGVNQPPSYASQVPPEQGPMSLQPYNVPPPSQVVPTAPAPVLAQAPPPQYAQVASQQQQQPAAPSQYGQPGTQQMPAQAPPVSQFTGKAPPAPTGQPQYNQMPPQGQTQYPRQTQPPQAQQQFTRPQPVSLDPTQSQIPPAQPQSFQPPPAAGFQSMDASRGAPQPQFAPAQMQPQATMAPSLGAPQFQQVPQMQQAYEPQQQQQQQQQQQPQQFAPQPAYQPAPPQPPPVQQQPPPQQYYGSAPPPQQSGPVPQRQLTDLELISFD